MLIRNTPRAALLAALSTLAFAQTPATPEPNIFYRFSPDSLVMEGIPQGEVKGPFTLPSQAYPGTQHTYWVYVPAQYDPAVAASRRSGPWMATSARRW
jgi:enterochelin esterase family protein